MENKFYNTGLTHATWMLIWVPRERQEVGGRNR
jgi:hypothetical protein